jgi:superfamily II DNA or RNA helicase
MGQIEAPTGDGKTWIIVQVCKMYPRARIVIIAPGIDVTKTIRDRLTTEIPRGDIGQIGGGRREFGRRVTVCVRNSIHKADLDNCQIILYDECHTAAGEVTSKALTNAMDCKMFGFSASTEMRTDNADMLVEAHFGPVIHVTTYQESQHRGNIVPLRVLLRSVGLGPVVRSANSSVLNRHGLWRNKFRNKLIAEDALSHSAHGEQVLISVGTVEHGLELMRYLGDSFAFVYSNMDVALRKRYEKEGVITEGNHPITTQERVHMQEEFEAGRLLRVISTCWNQGVDFRNLQVLIRADGMGSDIRSVQLPGRLSRTADGKSFGLLIDYLDEFDERLHRRAQKRIRLYRKKGWDIQVPPKKVNSSVLS